MFNTHGEVIGINTAIYSPTGGSVGIGFAIPSNLAKPVINQLLEFGRTRRGWLGVRIQGVSEEIAESLGLSTARGALVASISEGSPAQDAGFEAGDIILNFNDRPLDEMKDLPRMVAETPIDSKVKVVLWRDGKEKTVKVKIGELEKAEEEGKLEDTQEPQIENNGLDVEVFGLTLAPITPALRDQFGYGDELKGVFIAAVAPNSIADRQGLSTGDVIIEVDQKEVSSAKQVQAAVKRLQKAKSKAALMLINTQGQGRVRFVALKFPTQDDAKKSDDDKKASDDKQSK
tara:strand:- start:58 stop:921 length:864 start_codon:yes stop_codon:yes gene_type:complete